MRLDYQAVAPEGVRAVYGLQNYVSRHTDLDEKLKHLVEMRCSQINGCAFCLHLHALQLRDLGESDVRIDSLAAWEETDLFDSKERAALAWAEALTLVGETHAPDDVYEALRKEFSGRQMVDLTLAISVINVWNRLSIGFRTDPRTASGVFARLKGAPKPTV